MTNLDINARSKTFNLKLLLTNGTAVIALLAMSAPAFAQVDNATGIADPSRAGQELLNINDLPDLSEKIEVKNASLQNNAPEGAENIQFKLERIEIDGVSAYKASDLTPVYEKQLGQTVSLADVYEIAKNLTNKYRNEGFILTQVVVPPQTIENGTIQLRVVEGFIDEIIIEGEERTSIVKQIRKYADNLRENNILNARNLERYLLLINDLPGISARSVLSPSKSKTGASDLTIIIDRDMYEGSVSFNNFGSRYLGPYQLAFSNSANSWLGLNERIFTQFVISGDKDNADELLFGALSYEQPISRYGTKIKLTGSVTSTTPGYDLRQYDVSGMSKFIGATVTHPFIRSRSVNITGRATFDLRNVDSKNNLEPNSRRDRIRSLRLGAAFQFMDTLFGVGVNAIDIEVSKGVNILGASFEGDANLTRAGGTPQYTKARFQAQRLQRITSSINLLLAGQGQWAATPLLSSEEFGVGGTSFGRGYDSSEIVGDDGIAGKIELQWNDPYKVKHLKNYQLFTFFDTGRVWDQDATTSAGKVDSLSSVGFGVNANITDKAVANFGVAFPLTRNVDTKGDKSTRYYFNLTHKF